MVTRYYKLLKNKINKLIDNINSNQKKKITSTVYKITLI